MKSSQGKCEWNVYRYNKYAAVKSVLIKKPQKKFIKTRSIMILYYTDFLIILAHLRWKKLEYVTIFDYSVRKKI